MFLSSEECVILFGSVPDRRRKWNFYNTAERRTAYIIHKIFSREAIGIWWDKQYIRKLWGSRVCNANFMNKAETYILHIIDLMLKYFDELITEK